MYILNSERFELALFELNQSDLIFKILSRDVVVLTIKIPKNCDANRNVCYYYKIQIHLRIEQIFEITGTAPVVPFDSFSQVNATTSLDVSKIILDKVGDQCPPGTTKKGDLCSY